MSARDKRSPDDLRIAFNADLACLRVRVTGAGTFENTIAYWKAIVAEVQRRDFSAVLLIDELHGEPLGKEQWQALVATMAGQGLEYLRIAHVKPNGLQTVEYCEIYAKEAGLDTHVFADEQSAAIWLRYGERRHSGTRGP